MLWMKLHATCHADLVRSNQRQAAAITVSTSATFADIDAGRSEMGTNAVWTLAGVTTLIPPTTELIHGDKDRKLDTPQHQHQQEDKDIPLVASGVDVPASLKRKMEQARDDKNQEAAKTDNEKLRLVERAIDGGLSGAMPLGGLGFLSITTSNGGSDPTMGGTSYYGPSPTCSGLPRTE
ncbi:hypothetical protein BG004_007856 [Podila humilis]|nr:hypothetical protein BG004_007856 [Podila humilis]